MKRLVPFRGRVHYPNHIGRALTRQLNSSGEQLLVHELMEGEEANG